jgi:hypothetical protein
LLHLPGDALTVRLSVEREGPHVVVAFRDEKSGAHATLEFHRRESASLAACVAAVSGAEDDESELECQFRGRLHVEPGKFET